jgi:hypothetical protein
MRRHHYHYENEPQGAAPCEEYPEDSGYTQDDLDRLYQDAFEGDSEAQWNID